MNRIKQLSDLVNQWNKILDLFEKVYNFQSNNIEANQIKEKVLIYLKDDLNLCEECINNLILKEWK